MFGFKKVCVTLVAVATAISPLTLSGPYAVQAASYADDKKPAFTDLNQAAPYAVDSIIGVKQRGLMSGLETGEFRPYEPMTREQIATILVKLKKLPHTATKSGFEDVDGNPLKKIPIPKRWSVPYVAAVAKAKLMTGDGLRFRPTDHITREELAVLLIRAVGNVDVAGKGSRLTISDRGDVSSWAKDYVQAALEMGLVAGDSEYFRPKELAQRQDVAVMVMNLDKALNTDWSVITHLDSQSIICNGVTYQIGSEVQGILNQGNREILKNAKIRFVANNKRIVKITGLEIFTAGSSPSYQDFSSNVVLDGNNARIDGDLIINSDYVSVKNLTVTGNLHATRSLQNAFYSNNLTVQGHMILDGGSLKVQAENTRLNTVQIRHDFANFEIKGNTTVTEVNITAKHATVKSTGNTISKLTINQGVEGVEISAPITYLDLKTRARLMLSGNMRVTYMTLPSGLTLRDVLDNYDKTYMLVSQTNGSTPPSTQVPTSTPSGNVIGTVHKGPYMTTGNVVSGIEVNIYKDNGGSDIGELVTSVVTDANGMFGVQLPKGDYFLRADSQLPDYADSNLLSITAPGNHVKHLSDLFLQAPQFKGTVRDQSGRPVANAQVVVSHPLKGYYLDTTNDQGQYAIGGLTVANDYTINIHDLSTTRTLQVVNDLWRISGGTSAMVRDYVMIEDEVTVAVPTINPFYRSSTSVSGSSVPNGKVYFFQGDFIVGTANVGADGRFVTDFFKPLYPGGNLLAYAQDAIGHRSQPVWVQESGLTPPTR